MPLTNLHKSCIIYLLLEIIYADMAESADALASGASPHKGVEVQVLLSAPKWQTDLFGDQSAFSFIKGGIRLQHFLQNPVRHNAEYIGWCLCFYAVWQRFIFQIEAITPVDWTLGLFDTIAVLSGASLLQIASRKRLLLKRYLSKKSHVRSGISVFLVRLFLGTAVVQLIWKYTRTYSGAVRFYRHGQRHHNTAKQNHLVFSIHCFFRSTR